MTLAVADSSALIRPNQQDGGPTDLTFRKTDFLDFLKEQGRIRPWQGSHQKEWALTYAGNASAELFSEHQAMPAFGKRTFTKARMSPWYARATAAITGHLRDIVAKGGTFEDLLEGELGDCLKSLMYLVETTLLGSAQDKGIASLIDANDVAHNIDPSVITLWASLETPAIGALDAADLQDFLLNLTNAPRGADPSVILAPMNQLRNYGNIQGVTVATSVLRGELPGQGSKPYDIGVMKNGMSFNGIPFRPIRTMTSTELYWLDLVTDDPAVYMMRDVETEELGKRNDNTEFVVSIGLAMQIPNRRMHGKMTGITA